MSNAVSFRIPGDSNTLTFNPCCLYDEYLPYHPTIFKKNRQTFINTDSDFLPGCYRCKLKEQTHGHSQRTRINQQIPDNIGDTIHKLEIVLDTTCNAACIQCGSTQSSLWRLELAKESAHGKVIHIQPESQIDSKIDHINNTVDTQQVKRWHFWGGEPLATDTHLKFLNKIEDLSDVSLAYTTNGSIFPTDDILELWSKCKTVNVNISTDGIKDRFHYIRYPLSWDKWTNTAERFKNETPSNMTLWINYCVLPLNALYTSELDEWLSANFSNHKNGTKITVNYMRGEGTVDAECTPLKLREEVWKRLGEHHTVSNILKELPVQDPSSMLTHLNRWDNHRRLSWRTTFPDIVRYF